MNLTVVILIVERRIRVPEKKERWLIQIVVPEGAYEGAADLIEDLTNLLEGDSEIEVVSVEVDADQTVSKSC